MPLNGMQSVRLAQWDGLKITEYIVCQSNMIKRHNKLVAKN